MAWHGAFPASTRVQERPGRLVSVVGVIAGAVLNFQPHLT
jgi:hypothetical protein